MVDLMRKIRGTRLRRRVTISPQHQWRCLSTSLSYLNSPIKFPPLTELFFPHSILDRIIYFNMLHIYKNQLQQYAQRELIGFPVYNTEGEGPPHDRQYRSTVIVNEKSYGTLESFPTRKEAEQAAAKVACQALLVNVAEETTDGGLYKNLLQEFAHKKGLCPSYQTVASGLSHKRVFVSTVEIGQQTFQGAEAKTKKQSEMYAAKVAYCTLTNRCPVTKSLEVSCMDESPVADNLSRMEPTATTKKHQDTSCEDPYLHAKRVKPSTESMNVNTPPPNFPSIVSNVINSQVENSFHVPAPAHAHLVTERTVENEPSLHVNTPPSSSFPCLVPYVINSPVENSSHAPAATAHPVIEHTVENEPVLPMNAPPPSNVASIVSSVVNSQVENSSSALPPVHNSSHVPAPATATAHPVIEQTVKNEPVLRMNAPPPSNVPSIVSNVVNSQVENSFPTPVDPVTKQTVGNEPLLCVNTPSPGNFPSFVSSVINLQVENSLPAPADPVAEQTIGKKPLLQQMFKTLVFPRKLNLPVPEGATVMPFSDDQWVAYKIDQNQSPMI
ncbi:hypothetical protein C2S53_013540 [Perilla frutescens var. hirtella]|uniref:DRBM domain-containing protein n=1 Tax=Perilla frutescens var. hirtella TaxID=608512 RepID=A0AAD4PDK2_PERFH|nr:hypothetical protein C2S53_013540 [Perilla frutescens var. hirtella]